MFSSFLVVKSNGRSQFSSVPCLLSTVCHSLVPGVGSGAFLTSPPSSLSLCRQLLCLWAECVFPVPRAGPASIWAGDEVLCSQRSPPLPNFACCPRGHESSLHLVILQYSVLSSAVLVTFFLPLSYQESADGFRSHTGIVPKRFLTPGGPPTSAPGSSPESFYSRLHSLSACHTGLCDILSTPSLLLPLLFPRLGALCHHLLPRLVQMSPPRAAFSAQAAHRQCPHHSLAS